MTIAVNPDDIRRTWDILFANNQVVELRILNTKKATVAGYFDDYAKLAQNAEHWSGHAPGVYFTLNPVDPTLLARSVNRVAEYVKLTTADNNIAGRRWLPIDFDPVRPAGISSTDAEHELALKRARECALWLLEYGSPAPILADSGNGAHLLVRVDLPNTPESTALVKNCIEAVALRFSDKAIAVDLTTFNPARIWKLYGTKACKGDSTPERPHRLASLLEVPENIEVADADLLKKLAAMAPEEPKRAQSYNGNGAAFDIDKFISKAGLDVAFTDAWNGGRKWILKTCPWNPDHTNRSAFILQFASGAVTAGCHHNGCSGKGWADLREMFEPGLQKKKAQAQPKFTGESHNARSPRKWVDAMEAIEEQEIDWLWRDRIPRGRLTEFLGDPGIGKSHAAQAIAACLSKGCALPGDVEPEAPLRTLILNFEDGAGDTIKPHLRKLGADMSMVGVPAKSNRLLPTQFNAAVLGQMLDEFPAALVVVDPALAILGQRATSLLSITPRQVMVMVTRQPYPPIRVGAGYVIYLPLQKIFKMKKRERGSNAT